MANADFHAIEKKWLDYWRNEGVYKFDQSSKKPVFSIDTPPPTVSGKMHLGHAFSYCQADMIARFKRMRGFEVFYPFGFDDNGLATERFVEKSRNIQAKNFSREEFIKICLDETRKAEEQLQKDFSSLGLSVDWSLVYRTIDNFARKQAQRSFLDIHAKGRLYQREAPAMWCPKCETSIAQAELEDMEKDSRFVHIRFDVEGGKSIVIATTRPELLPACVAFFVHPDDKRYASFVGRKVKIPFSDRTVLVHASDKAKQDVGTGAVYCCTFGDLTDVEWVMEFGLPIIEIIGKNGVLNDKAGRFAGKNVLDARKEVVEALEADGRVMKVEPLRHVANVHERCKTPVEILTSKQWFVKYLDLRETFIGRGKEVKWTPEHMRVRFDNWINGLKWDWNVSRQRFFGVPLPVWYCKKCKKPKLASPEDLPADPLQSKPKGKCSCGSSEFEPEKDVLDTWFTSSLTPQINCKWLEDEKLFKKLFPMSLRPQAHDIITLWAFNTVVKAHLHSNSLPWKQIMISGHALDPKGRKMSKSLGNVIAPQDMVSKYCADALRYWSASASLGEDVPFQEKEMVAGQKFLSKLLNAGKFVSGLTQGISLEDFRNEKKNLRPTDKWILSRLNTLKKSVTESMESFDFFRGLNPVRDFFWLEFADYYIEEVKYRAYDESNPSCKAAKLTLLSVYLDCLKMLSPFLPFVCEDIMQSQFSSHLKAKSIHLEEWPGFDATLVSDQAEFEGETCNSIVSALRKLKSSRSLAMNAELGKAEIFVSSPKAETAVKAVLEDVCGTMNVKSLAVSRAKPAEGAVKVSEEVFLSA
ncbi:MAG: valine--tRNA ligase [Candidatus Diapherotrites archaeon]|nr:valine--tRNA ligase [Candidatus Diapherotrites archaeon]